MNKPHLHAFGSPLSRATFIQTESSSNRIGNAVIVVIVFVAIGVGVVYYISKSSNEQSKDDNEAL